MPAAMQLVAHCDKNLELSAIVRKVFSLVIRPAGAVRKEIPVYQIIHIASGYHIASFTVADSAVGFFRDIDRYLPDFTNSALDRSKVKRLMVKWFAHQERHEEYFF
jgi:hypothetical protein